MDIARPDRARSLRRRRWLIGIFGFLVLAGLTAAVSQLKPALPSVERSTLLTGKVSFGEMVRNVRGNGSLVPKHVLVVPAEVPGRVVNILVKPGAEVEANTVLVELSNPQLKQEEFELSWQLKAAEAGLQELSAQLKQERLAKESLVAKLESDLVLARLEAAADSQLAAEGLVPLLTSQRTEALAKNLAAQLSLEKEQLTTWTTAEIAQLAVQESEIGRVKATIERKREDIQHLSVRAGTSGVVQQLGATEKQPLQPGEQIAAGAILAKIVRPSELIAQIKIAETQARDVQTGLPVEIDTRNGVIRGHVSRVDPAVVAGTVSVDVTLEDELPRGARPDLSIDGTIELDHLYNTLYMPRPVSAHSARARLFKVTNHGKEAVRVTVELGKISVSSVQILSGLVDGDEVILSDMELYSGVDRIRLR